MGSTDTQFNETRATFAFLAIALLVVVALVVAFLLMGLGGVGMLMVIVTPVMMALLVTISMGA